ncbi:MAG: hypothetical protein JWL90_3534 [Chthoniobacteraceae bacterium]|nr:hypothetical protein [Chthoniobacteraceae bacterium]
MRHFLLILLAAIIALPSSGRAVTIGDGPGTIGTTDGSSQLELWLKADALGLADGSPVSVWNDASGNGRNLTQANPSLQPVYAANALAGKPVVRFTADFFGSLALPSINNELTIIAVIKPAKTGAYHNILDGLGGTRPMLWVDGIGNYEFNFNSGAVTAATGSYDILFAVKRNSGAQYSQLYLNSPLAAASGPNAFAIAASQSYTFFNRSGSQAFNGDIAELIIYSSALTGAEIGKVGYYLQQKYSLASSFPSPFPILTGYQQNPVTYGVNVAITPNAPIVSGGTAAGFSISAALPAGLAFNTTTGVISGTPSVAASQATYTITATFSGQPDSSTQVSIGVASPSVLGYSRDPVVFTRGRVVQPIQPLLRGGPAAGFAISPTLPAGLIFNPQTGTISGSPTVSSPTAAYTVTANFSGYPSSSYVLTLEVVEPATTLDITEFMASNDSTIVDGDGSFSDWIEINNYGAVPIDLDGWALTDDSGNLRKWTFPPRILAPGAYLLVFASGDSHVDPAGNPHTSFKLDGNGEYLALVQSDGVTIARQFAPMFPAQAVGVSYGTRDHVTYGAYAQPTPGAANGFFDASSSVVVASPPGRNFSGTINITLSAPLVPGAVIGYTLNGTLPTASSPAYGGPISLSANSRLRARVFQPGLGPGPETSEVYLRLGADLQGFSSNLPLVFLSTDQAIAASSSPALTGTNAVIVGVDELNGRASATGVPNYSGRSGLRIRGRSSQSFPQKQYKFETWDGAGRESDASLLRLGSSSDWVLSSPWSEKSLVRNALAYRTWENLGWPSLGTRFVEVFINDDNDSQFTYSDDYAGVYMLVESISLERLGLSGPQNTTDAAGITGGFITETGNADDQDFSTTGCGRDVAHKHRDPSVTKLNSTQRTWIRGYISKFEQALYGNGFIHPATGQHYSAYTDVASQVDYKIAREWSRNYDGGSTYSYLPRGGKLTMGPLWDYNWAFGNVNYAEGGDLPGYRTDGWNRSFTSNTNGWSPWWLRFEQDPDWWQLFADRWSALRATLLSDTAVNSQIDALTLPLTQEAAARNFARWPQLGVFTVVSAPGYETRTTYQSEIDYLKTWLHNRSLWIDSQFLLHPAFSRVSGPLASGTTVTLSAGPGSMIYYMTDGSDPRAPGGGVAAGALSVATGASVTINTSIILAARARIGTAWSAPSIATYVTGNPASAQNLVISEIAYHPADPTPEQLANNPALSDDDFEFIELRNISAGAIDLTGVSFSEGLRFAFPSGATLAAGAHVVVVRNTGAFGLRYGAANVAGQYLGNLNNSGDTVLLLAASGNEIARIHYSDAWSAASDGAGYTLTLLDPANVPADYSNPAAWGLSGSIHGSPGAANGPVFTSDFTLWQRSHFAGADLDDPERSGPLADPDHDGASNLLEMSLTTDPLDSSSRPLTFLTLPTFTFTRLRQTLGINFSVEESPDCRVWTAVNTALQIVSQSDTTETVHATIPQTNAPARFFRLRVTK